MRNLSINNLIIAILSLSFALTSCNTTFEVTKRKYRKGYHVSISNSKNQKERDFGNSIKEKLASNSIQSDDFSQNIVQSDSQKQLMLSSEHQIGFKDLNNVESNSRLNSISSLKKNNVSNNARSAKVLKEKIRNLKRKNGLKSSKFDDDEIDSDLMFVLLLILAVILPPACVYMIKGKDSFPFKLNLVLWLVGLLGWGLFRVLTINFVWLAYALAIVHAILVLLGHA